jgi:hypothetical protein
MLVNHKRVLRLMQVDNLLAVRKQIRSDYGFQPRIRSLPERGQADGIGRCQPVMGGRSDLTYACSTSSFRWLLF